MPPIFGILNTSLQAIDQQMVRRMKGAAHYIRPHWIEVLESASYFMASANVISIQLVRCEDATAVSGKWCVVTDAALYKREELLKKMGRGGEEERGRKGEGERDAELILEAYLKWGEQCLHYLYGDFAFVIFNRETGEVFCGRDPLGVKPLFYSITDQGFIFASELRCLVAALPNKPPVREEYLLETLITVKTDKGKAPFENTFRLKPGYFLRYSDGSTWESPYWSTDLNKIIRLDKEEDYIQLFREKLVQAVKCRCKGVASLGAELSGGLDSSAVCGIAADIAQLEKTPFTAFSNIFPAGTDTEFKDEREFIEAMLQFKSLNWVGVDSLSLPIPELLQYAMNIQGCFIQQNYNIFNRGIHAAAGEQGVHVLLSGFGGDELVSARTSLPWNELIRERQWRVMADELFHKGITPKSVLKPGLLAARYLYALLYQPKYKTGVFTQELLDKRFANLPLQPKFAVSSLLRQRLGYKYRQPWYKVLAWRQYARIIQNHLPQRMEYCYTAAAQYGLEYRYPLLDLDLIETCLAFPPWIKLHHGINRYLFRQAIIGFVPEKIRQRDDKSGTTIPQTYYSLITESEAIMNLINSCSGSAYLNEIFDLARFPQWYDKLVQRDEKDMNYLMPGAFYEYLMILIYFRDKGQGTRKRNENLD